MINFTYFDNFNEFWYQNWNVYRSVSRKHINMCVALLQMFTPGFQLTYKTLCKIDQNKFIEWIKKLIIIFIIYNLINISEVTVSKHKKKCNFERKKKQNFFIFFYFMILFLLYYIISSIEKKLSWLKNKMYLLYFF